LILCCWAEEEFHVIYPKEARKAKVLEFENGEAQGEGTVNEELNAVIMEPQSVEDTVVDDVEANSQKKTAKSLLNTFPFNVPNDEEHSHDHHHADHGDHHEEHHGEHHEHHEEAASKATQGKFPFALPLRAPLSNRQGQASESFQSNPPTILNEIATSGTAASGRKCIDKVSVNWIVWAMSGDVSDVSRV